MMPCRRAQPSSTAGGTTPRAVAMRVRAIPARQASITGGEPGDAPRARASIRSNFVLWIPVERWISHDGPDAECPLEPIQPTGVVGEDLLLLAVVEVPAL